MDGIMKGTQQLRQMCAFGTTTRTYTHACAPLVLLLAHTHILQGKIVFLKQEKRKQLVRNKHHSIPDVRSPHQEAILVLNRCGVPNTSTF